MEHPVIKNIIFDLGNVVIDILPKATYDAFASISRTKNSEEVEKIIAEKKLWHNYEKGLISDSKFRELLRSNLDLDATDAEIDVAFNALLLDIDTARIDLIEQLSKKYRTFVLSNTSEIHMVEFENILKKCTDRDTIWNIFEKPFFSFDMGLLKPDPQIYKTVISEAGLLPSETLFLDDLKANVEAANLLGINTIHIVPPITIIDHLNGY